MDLYSRAILRPPIATGKLMSSAAANQFLYRNTVQMMNEHVGAQQMVACDQLCEQAATKRSMLIAEVSYGTYAEYAFYLLFSFRLGCMKRT